MRALSCSDRAMESLRLEKLDRTESQAARSTGPIAAVRLRDLPLAEASGVSQEAEVLTERERSAAPRPRQAAPLSQAEHQHEAVRHDRRERRAEHRHRDG